MKNINNDSRIIVELDIDIECKEAGDTSATLFINQGVHPKIISERLGHANIGTTMNIYGHVLAKADKEADNKFDEILPIKRRKDA